MNHLRWRDICTHAESVHLARTMAPQPVSWREHTHDFYECFLVEEGTGQHCLPLAETQSLDYGDLVFIRPEHAHGFRVSRGNTFGIVNVAIRAEIAKAFLARHRTVCSSLGIWMDARVPRSFRLSRRAFENVQRLISDLGEGGRTELEAEWFMASISIYLQQNTDRVSNHLPDWLGAALPVASSPENLRGGVRRLSQLAGRSPEHLARSFRKYLAMTPGEWITQARMKLAQRLLETTNLTIAEIALECGMENLSHFHRSFRLAFGTTPLRYRNKAVRSIRVE